MLIFARSFFIICFYLLFILPSFSSATRVEITEGVFKPIPLAIPEFYSTEPIAGDFGRKITQVIGADLENCGLFKIIDPASFIQDRASLQQEVRFADWRLIQAQALVVGTVTIQGKQLNISFRLFDIYTQQQLSGFNYQANPHDWRRVAHRIADEIYKRLTNENGYFSTQIAFVAETGTPRKRIRRLAIMDQDGENFAYLTNGQHMVLMPSFSPTRYEIAYLQYHEELSKRDRRKKIGRKPKVYLLKLGSGTPSRQVGIFSDMTSSPNFTPDGNIITLSHAKDGIYNINLQTNEQKRLTHPLGIDTTPSWSPDGQQLVFSSDRGGTFQIYVMDADGTNSQRISQGDGTYGDPAWSPRGDLICFTKITDRQFYIGVMRPDGSGERLLTSGYMLEAPHWSPNGRVIIFTRQTPSDRNGNGGSSRLYMIDVTGHHERLVPTPTDGMDPTWGPLIK